MKKFYITMETTTTQRVVYVVESKDREHLEKELETFSPADIGEIYMEYEPEFMAQSITEIKEENK